LVGSDGAKQGARTNNGRLRRLLGKLPWSPRQGQAHVHQNRCAAAEIADRLGSPDTPAEFLGGRRGELVATNQQAERSGPPSRRSSPDERVAQAMPISQAIVTAMAAADRVPQAMAVPWAAPQRTDPPSRPIQSGLETQRWPPLRPSGSEDHVKGW